jgi:soluble cytochrome b562
MDVNNLSDEHKARIKHTLDEAINTMQEIKDLREGMNDLVNTVAADLNIPKKELAAAVKLGFKKANRTSVIEEEKESLDLVETLLNIAGR